MLYNWSGSNYVITMLKREKKTFARFLLVVHKPRWAWACSPIQSYHVWVCFFVNFSFEGKVLWFFIIYIYFWPLCYEFFILFARFYSTSFNNLFSSRSFVRLFAARPRAIAWKLHFKGFSHITFNGTWLYSVLTITIPYISHSLNWLNFNEIFNSCFFSHLQFFFSLVSCVFLFRYCIRSEKISLPIISIKRIITI